MNVTTPEAAIGWALWREHSATPFINLTPQQQSAK